MEKDNSVLLVIEILKTLIYIYTLKLSLIMISSLIRINRALQEMEWVYVLMIYFPPRSNTFTNDINTAYNNVAGVIDQR